VEVVENATGYKCAISPATNDLNVVQIPKIYIAVQCILNIFTSAFMHIMNLLTRPIFTVYKCIKEIVFRRPNPRLYINPVPISEVQQVTSAKLLGITLCDTLHFDAHIGNVLKMCSQRLYLLKLLRDQGLPRHHLNIVFDALVVH